MTENVLRSSRAKVSVLQWSCTVALSLMAVGCGDPTGRQRVTGTVTVDGSPLPEARISLRPLARGPRTGGIVENGEFQISKQKGPLPGEYAVAIQSFRKTGRMISPESNPGVKVPELRQSLPPNYNTRTELRMEVTPGGTNHFEYDLQSAERE